MLKERRKLVLVARETPLSLDPPREHGGGDARGRAGAAGDAVVLRTPQTIEAVLDTVVGRVLDQLGLPIKLGPRWGNKENVDERHR